MAEIDTTPLSFDIGAGEVANRGVDGTAYLPTGASIASATPTLVEANSQAAYPSGILAHSLSGNVCTAQIGNLVAGKTYGLFVMFFFSDGTNEKTHTVIKCPA